MSTTIRYLPTTQHLTARDANQEQTFVGQAYFAGTGPEGKTCGSCAHWQGKPQDKQCVKFQFRGAQKSGRVPSYALACKYFDEVA